MLELINSVYSLQSMQNNSPALCRVNKASNRHCIHFKKAVELVRRNPDINRNLEDATYKETLQ